jgi:hypothetical protein
VAYWSEFLATDPEARVRFLALPDFRRNSGCGKIYSALEEKNIGSGLETENKAVGIRHIDHVVPSFRKSWH